MAEQNHFEIEGRGDAVTFHWSIPGHNTASWGLRFCLLTNQADDPSLALITVTSGFVQGDGFIAMDLNTTQTDRAGGRYFHTLSRTDVRKLLSDGVVGIGQSDASA